MLKVGVVTKVRAFGLQQHCQEVRDHITSLHHVELTMKYDASVEYRERRQLSVLLSHRIGSRCVKSEMCLISRCVQCGIIQQRTSAEAQQEQGPRAL